MQTLILTLHIIACIVLTVLVLLQSGKEGMGVIFGGGSSSMFGGAGAGGMLAKLTAVLAALFIVTSLSYNYISGADRRAESSIIDVQVEKPKQAPVSIEEPAEKPAASEQ
ncbi:preprotein translocase subunit SecG [Oleidesulfovibrio sp.]|uniref:preprotein translocase subunit SecG n=1 Tax=Oleidesulfovibrio sp. TaxID=2909707 RepID=UPI003A8B7C97